MFERLKSYIKRLSKIFESTSNNPETIKSISNRSTISEPKQRHFNQIFENANMLFTAGGVAVAMMAEHKSTSAAREDKLSEDFDKRDAIDEKIQELESKGITDKDLTAVSRLYKRRERNEADILRHANTTSIGESLIGFLISPLSKQSLQTTAKYITNNENDAPQIKSMFTSSPFS